MPESIILMRIKMTVDREKDAAIVSSDLPSSPEDSQLYYQGQHYKIGLHGFVFVWRWDEEWHKAPEMNCDIKHLILSEKIVSPCPPRELSLQDKRPK